MYHQTTCCCKSNQTVSNFLAFDSIQKKRMFRIIEYRKYVRGTHTFIHINNKNIRTVVSSSCNTWSYSDIATQNMMAVTSSKQWIHFFRSDLWPPTSNSLKKRNDIQLDVYHKIFTYCVIRRISNIIICDIFSWMHNPIGSNIHCFYSWVYNNICIDVDAPLDARTTW